MANKIYDWDQTAQDGAKQYWFLCPGCKRYHEFTVGGDHSQHPSWEWNGSFDVPTFRPSLLCNQHHQASRCHSYVTDGKIQFLSDCFHELKNQTVEIPDWDW